MATVTVVCLLLAVCALGSGARVPSQDVVSAFLQGVRELEEERRELETLLSPQIPASTREQLEEDAGKTDGSASQESDREETTPKPGDKRSEAGDDDVTDEEDEDDVTDDLAALRPFLGNLPSVFGISRPKSWWSGEHVCVDRDEKEEKSEDFGGDFIAFGAAHFSTCQSTPSKYSCKTITKKNGVTKTSVVTYQCCHGYRRTANSQSCIKVETKPIAELAEELGAGRFGRMVVSSELRSVLEGNVTVFMPVDSALTHHQAGMDGANQLDPVLTNEVPSAGPQEEKAFVLDHVVEGPLEVADMSDDMVLRTKGNSTLRVSFLPNRQVAVNCVRLNATDRLTPGGVVHLLEGVLEPRVDRDLGELLSAPQFSVFRAMLQQNDLWELMSADRALTVFAVENEAASKLGDKHKMCMKNILAHHILPHSLCSATAAEGQNLATLDLSGGWLPFTSAGGSMLLANSTRVGRADLVATNGVLHVAEGFVMPSGARLLSELLEQTNHTLWLGVLRDSGLLERLETAPNLTLFVPTDRAVTAAGLSELGAEQLRDLVSFHVGRSQEGNAVSTLLQGSNLTVSTEKSVFPGLLGGPRFMAVQCQRLTKLGGRTCNGLVHELDAVLRPPNATLLEFLAEEESLSVLRSVLKDTKLEQELRAPHPNTPLTFLAPSDAAFQDLGQENLDSLLQDKQLADQILRAHVLTEPVCCESAQTSTWPFVPSAQTLAGRPVEVNRRGTTAVFGAMPVVSCDHLVKGGIVHVVNGVRLTRSKPRDRELVLRRPNSEIILAGI